MKKVNNIEDIFREKLADFSQNPNDSVWKKIDKNISKNNFLKFNAGKFNIYYSVIIALVILTSAVIFNSPTKQNSKNAVSIANINENKTIIDTVISQQKNINTIEEEKTKIENKIIKIKSEKTITETQPENTEKIVFNHQQKNNSLVITKTETQPETQNPTIENSPKPEFSADYYIGCAPLEVCFTNTSENCKNYLWDFGNGAKSPEINPKYTFTEAGKYTVNLISTQNGKQIVKSKNIIVHPKPQAGVIISNKNNLYTNDNIKFANISSGAQQYKWNFGDGNSSDEMHPEHSYQETGVYNISLQAISDQNCSGNMEEYRIVVRDSKYKIIAPNAFTPSMNGPVSIEIGAENIQNNLFYPIFKYDIAEYKLKIYNRRGILVFETNRPKTGWNGYYRNELLPMDVYIWECSGKFIDGENFYNSGDISLIHTKR